LNYRHFKNFLSVCLSVNILQDAWNSSNQPARRDAHRFKQHAKSGEAVTNLLSRRALDNSSPSEAGVAEVEFGLVGGIVFWQRRVGRKAAGSAVLSHRSTHVLEEGDELRVPSSKRVV